MKVCKKNHEPIVFLEEEISCPLCGTLDALKHNLDIIQDMHDTALRREDYIALIESQNESLRTTHRIDATTAPLPFVTENWTIITSTLPTVKPTKKRTTKKTKK